MDKQLVCAVLAALTHLAIGTIIGLPGVILPQLTDPTSRDIFLTTSEVALFGKSQSPFEPVTRPVSYPCNCVDIKRYSLQTLLI